MAWPMSARTRSLVEIRAFAHAQLGPQPEIFAQVRADAPITTVTHPGYLTDFETLGGPCPLENPRVSGKIVDPGL